MFKLLTSYLSERYICVKIDGKVSSSRLLDHGVPQGSILGPLLFLLYINDLPNASNFETTLFADDTNLHLSHININSLQSRVQLEMMKVSKWMISNKLTINYKKSCYMLKSKKPLNDSNFSVLINQNLIEKSECVKYLGVHLDNKLSWRTHIDKICKKVSKVCGMIYKLRYYVPLSTLKIVYFSLFHSHIQYSLLNWGRASKSILYKLKILQNKILRAMLFCSKQDRTNLLYFKLKILKLENMIAMEYAKFIFKFNNHMLPDSFNCYFTKLENVHKYNTKQKQRNEYFQFRISSESGRKTLHHICLQVWKNVPTKFRHCPFSTYKKFLKSNIVSNYYTNK